MATTAFSRPATTAPRAIQRATGESAVIRWTLTAAALAFLALTLVLPLILVFHEALAKGFAAYLDAIREPAPHARDELGQQRAHGELDGRAAVALEREHVLVLSARDGRRRLDRAHGRAAAQREGGRRQRRPHGHVSV